MRRVLCCAVVICLASAVSAASVHFVRGPVVTDDGVILVVEGKLAGLGEGDITVLVNATGVASVECTNPGGNVARGQDTGFGEGDITVLVNGTGIASGECTNPGGNVAPGQDTAVRTSGSITLPSAKNGHLTFAV